MLPLSQQIRDSVYRGANGGGRCGYRSKGLCVFGLIEREVAYEFSRLSVHREHVFVSVPCGIEQPHGEENVPCLSVADVHRAALGNHRRIARNGGCERLLGALTHALVRAVAPLDRSAMTAAEEHQARLAKPPGSLGRLEEISIQLAGITGHVHNALNKKQLLVFAADNGVVAEGVSSAPQSVTKQQTINLMRGKTGAAVLAKHLEPLGIDAVIAEGTESGGHVGEMTTMALVPQVVDAVNVPVIAAGGIADGRQLAAALALGACGVQVGTCLLVSEECPIHENYKAALLKAKDSDTIVTGRSVGAPVRVLKNRMSREYVRQENAGADKMELEKYTLGSLRRAVFEGDTTTGSLMAGQVAGMLHEVRPVADILADLWDGGRQRIAALSTEC